MTELSLGSADALFALIEKHGIDCDARQKGWLRADHCEAAADASRKAAQKWNRYGAAFEFVDCAGVRAISGTDRYVSGTVAKSGGAIHPMSLVRGLARVAEEAGAQIFIHSRVASMDPQGDRWILHVNGHRVTTNRVIHATNGYTDNLNAKLKRSVLPLTPIQIATKPLGNNQIADLLPQGHTISDTRRLTMYCRREPGDRFVYGGIGYRKSGGTVGGFQWLMQDVAKVFPTLSEVDWEFRWSGQIALTSDHVPHFHEPAPGVSAGLGYNGRGVAMAVAMGKVLADHALGAEVGSLPFPVSPMKPTPFRETQVLGAGVAMSFLRWRDQKEAARG